MSSFTISALCAVLSMCYTPSQLTRQSTSFIGTPSTQRIVAGSSYQITAQGTSFVAAQSWTLTSSNSVILNPTCTYSTNSINNRCTWSDVFTASDAPGTTVTYTAHDNTSNQNFTFNMIIASPVPAQPLLASTSETSFVVTPSSGAASCVVVSAPTSYMYEAADLPSTWTGAWATKPSYVTYQSFGDLSTNPRILAGQWATLAGAGITYDFHTVCYNSVGPSMRFSAYNLVAVGSSTAPAPRLISAVASSASSFRITFQSPDTWGAIGFYPDNVPVQSSSCVLHYGVSETAVTLSQLDNGVNHVFTVSSVDLRFSVPFTISCTVAGRTSSATQGRIAAVSTGLSSSAPSWLSSSSAPVGLSSSSEVPVMVSSSSAVLASSSSAPAGLSSSSAPNVDLSSSTGTAVIVSSSSSSSAPVDVVSSSSSQADTVSSSSSVIISSSAAESSSADVVSSSSAAVSSSTAVASSSSTGSVSSSSSSSTAAASSSSRVSSSSSSSSSSSRSSSSSSAVISPISDVPAGTVSVTFSIDLPNGIVTEAVVSALQTDIASNIASQYNSTTAEIKPFIIVTVGTMTSSNRRLLTDSVPVSFMVLGNITTVTGGEGGSSQPFNALAAATSVTSALSQGTFVSTETATFGVSVPQQTVEILPVIAPEQPSSSSSSTGESSSSTGVFEEAVDSSSSGISDGAIAGAVVGSILGALVLLAIVVLAARSGAFSKCFTVADPVAQVNANDIVRNKDPLPIASFEENVDMGYTDMPVRIHTDSPVARPESSPATPPNTDMVYANDANDTNDVQVTIENRD